MTRVKGGKAMVGSAKDYEYSVVDGCVRIERFTARGQDVVLPELIDGMPVTEIAPYAFEGNADIRTVVCSAKTSQIGSRAFANCPMLERVVFPKSLARYENSWIAGCARVEEIVLPGAIVDLDLVAPAPIGVKRIVIGEMTRSVKMARAWKLRLEQVDVHPENKWLSSDGTCVYTADGTELLVHATKSSEVRVRAGCVRIAPCAFELETHLEHVVLPEGVSDIGERAFAESALVGFKSPHTLRSIGREAFAGCQSLVEVGLVEGLRDIGDRAFAECSACAALRLPASVEHVGRKVFEDTGLQPCGDQETLTVEHRNPSLFIDEFGVLCKRESEGVVVLEALDRQTKSYRTPEGATRVAERAFFEHLSLERLEIREGVLQIGCEAFMRCNRLREVSLPASLKRLEARAFATTGLNSCNVPASVEHLGECALAFNYKNWHPTTNPPIARAHVTLEPGNERYFVEGGLLYERCDGGAAQVVLYVGPDIDLSVAHGARRIAPYAFFGVQGIRELRLPEDIEIGEATFAMRKPPERIVLQGEDGIVFETMRDWRGVCALQRAFAGAGTTDAELLCATFDEEALSAQADYEAYRYIVTRLAGRKHLAPDARKAFERMICEAFDDVCATFGRHEDRASVDRMVDIGLINADNIDQAIEAASTADSAPMMAHLYDLKRNRFGSAVHDYGL